MGLEERGLPSHRQGTPLHTQLSTQDVPQESKLREGRSREHKPTIWQECSSAASAGEPGRPGVTAPCTHAEAPPAMAVPPGGRRWRHTEGLRAQARPPGPCLPRVSVWPPPSTMRRASQHCSVAGLGGGPELSTQGEEARVPPAGSAPATSRKWGHDSPEGRPPQAGSGPATSRKWALHKPEVGAQLTGRAPPSSRKWARHEPEVDPPQAGPGGEGLALTLLPSLRLWLLAPGSFGFVLVSLRSGRVLVSLLSSVP